MVAAYTKAKKQLLQISAADMSKISPIDVVGDHPEWELYLAKTALREGAEDLPGAKYRQEAIRLLSVPENRPRLLVDLINDALVMDVYVATQQPDFFDNPVSYQTLCNGINDAKRFNRHTLIRLMVLAFKLFRLKWIKRSDKHHGNIIIRMIAGVTTNLLGRYGLDLELRAMAIV